MMKIYIDFDDVLCETAEYFTKIAKEMFGIGRTKDQIPNSSS